MNREEKNRIVQDLVERISDAGNNFYIADIGGMSVNENTVLRKMCYEQGIHLQVAKNKLVVKALEQLNITDSSLVGSLKGESSIMIASNMKAPGELIKGVRKKMKKPPMMKSAYIQEAVFVGDDKLEQVLAMKSKEEVLGEIVSILQSPAQRVISALLTPGRNLASILSLEGDGKLADQGKKEDKNAA